MTAPPLAVLHGQSSVGDRRWSDRITCTVHSSARVRTCSFGHDEDRYLLRPNTGGGKNIERFSLLNLLTVPAESDNEGHLRIHDLPQLDGEVGNITPRWTGQGPFFVAWFLLQRSAHL